jgi:uncharacterized delta-60 repeat protein/uncharacterized repeat protein (TIGR01451 family)
MGARCLAGLTAAVLLALPATAHSAPASPDPAFGTGGVVVMPGFGAQAAGMLLDSAGRPVVIGRTGASEVGFVRLAPNGAQDRETSTTLANAGEIAEVAELLGGYAAGGWVEPGADRQFALVRFDAAGTGVGGTTDLPGAGDEEIRALAVQPDGRIVAAGSAQNGIGVVRYLANGTPELVRVHDLAGITGEEASGVVVEPGGRILLAGTGVVGGERRFLLVALTPAGDIDPTFRILPLDVGDGNADVRSLERQPDGKLLVAGTTDAGGGGGGVVARFLADGTPDLSYSTDGIARPGVVGAIVEDVALQPDGKAVAVGDAGGDSLITRFRTGGARDPGFGSDGVVRRSLGASGADALTGVGIAAGGGIVAGGVAPGGSIALMKLVGGDSSDPALAMTAASLGDLVHFTITATNPGADPATGVNVAVVRPDGVAATALTTAAGACSATSCSLGTLPAGATRRMSLLARARRPGPLTASAQISAATFDTNPGNNSAGATGSATRNRVVRRDRTGPKLRLRLRAKRIRQVRKRVKLAVRTSEAALVVVRTRFTTAGRTASLARSRTMKLRRKGAKTVYLKLTKAGRKAVKRKKTRRLAVSVKATGYDRAGNKGAKTLRKTLRR